MNRLISILLLPLFLAANTLMCIAYAQAGEMWGVLLQAAFCLLVTGLFVIQMFRERKMWNAFGYALRIAFLVLRNRYDVKFGYGAADNHSKPSMRYIAVVDNRVNLRNKGDGEEKQPAEATNMPDVVKAMRWLKDSDNDTLIDKFADIHMKYMNAMGIGDKVMAAHYEVMHEELQKEVVELWKVETGGRDV